MCASWRARGITSCHLIENDMKMICTKFHWYLNFGIEDIIDNIFSGQKYKMASTWRHGWLIMLRGAYDVNISRTKVQWEFHLEWEFSYREKRVTKSIQKLRKSFTGKGLNKSQPSFKKAIKASKSFNKSQRQLDKKLGDLKQSRNAEVEPSIVQTKEFSSISSFQSM